MLTSEITMTKMDKYIDQLVHSLPNRFNMTSYDFVVFFFVCPDEYLLPPLLCISRLTTSKRNLLIKYMNECVLIRNLACAFTLNVHKRKGKEIEGPYDELVNHTQQTFVGFSSREKIKFFTRKKNAKKDIDIKHIFKYH